MKAAGIVAVAVAALCAVASASALPYKASAVGQDTSQSFGSDGIHLTSVVHGTGTEIGRFTQTLDYVLFYDLVHFAGTGTITAADGSELFVTDSGTEPGFAAQVFPTPFFATFTITGGTRRFAGASGGGTLVGVDFGAGAFSFTVDGVLSR